MRRLRIGVDFDGPVVNTNATKVLWVRKHLGRAIEPWACSRGIFVDLGLPETVYDEMLTWTCSMEGTMASLPAPGVAEALKRLASWSDLLLVSLRGASEGWIEAAELWLRSNGMLDLFAGKIWMDGSVSKGDVCTANRIRVLVDDDPQKIETLDPSQTIGILYLPHAVAGPWTSHRFFSNWNEVVAECERIVDV